MTIGTIATRLGGGEQNYLIDNIGRSPDFLSSGTMGGAEGSHMNGREVGAYQRDEKNSCSVKTAGHRICSHTVVRDTVIMFFMALWRKRIDRGLTSRLSDAKDLHSARVHNPLCALTTSKGRRKSTRRSRTNPCTG